MLKRVKGGKEVLVAELGECGRAQEAMNAEGRSAHRRNAGKPLEANVRAPSGYAYVSQKAVCASGRRHEETAPRMGAGAAYAGTVQVDSVGGERRSRSRCGVVDNARYRRPPEPNACNAGTQRRSECVRSGRHINRHALNHAQITACPGEETPPTTQQSVWSSRSRTPGEYPGVAQRARPARHNVPKRSVLLCVGWR